MQSSIRLRSTGVGLAAFHAAKASVNRSRSYSQELLLLTQEVRELSRREARSVWLRAGLPCRFSGLPNLLPKRIVAVEGLA